MLASQIDQLIILGNKVILVHQNLQQFFLFFSILRPLAFINNILHSLINLSLAKFVILDNGFSCFEASDIGECKLGDYVIFDLTDLLGLHTF